MSDVLVVEISGKRPGNVSKRPTERFCISYDHLIISNNSDGYETGWKIVNVPLDYVEWYKTYARIGENSWYAPMNRSYAIKYAKEHGYKYLAQLDDNINFIEVAWWNNIQKAKKVEKRVRVQSRTEMMNEFIAVLVEVLKNSNAGMAGCNISGVASPDTAFLRERFCYSLFALKLDVVPPLFHGDYEDDMDYRLKLMQMGIPSVQVAPLRYSKVGQGGTKDLSGCRKEYIAAGVKRGHNMRKLYGDIYSCGMRSKSNRITDTKQAGKAAFKHRVKNRKVGVVMQNEDKIKDMVMEIARKYAKQKEDKCIIKVRKKHGKTVKAD